MTNEPTFRHLDDADIPWQKVKAQRNADGSESAVWEKWLAFSLDPQYLSALRALRPGDDRAPARPLQPAHRLRARGRRRSATATARAGTHIELPLGAAFGPIVAGPEGAVLFEVMMGDPRSWGDEPEVFDAALAEHGSRRALPDPPLDYPAWLARPPHPLGLTTAQLGNRSVNVVPLPGEEATVTDPPEPRPPP